MSISILLMPLALPAIPIIMAMRLVMGKKGFQKMIDSMHMKIPTSLVTNTELELVLLGAGYDFKPWASGYKTHLGRSSQFFTWELDGGRWVAVFPNGIPQKDVSDFIRSLEAKSGRGIFSDVEPDVNNDIAVASEYMPTNFRDEKLLLKTLEESGVPVTRDQAGVITCSVGQSVLRFVRIAGEPYQVEVKNDVGRHELLQQLMLLDEDYCRCVQADVYANIKAKAFEKHMTVESEEVLEDNSILMTLTIQERA